MQTSVTSILTKLMKQGKNNYKKKSFKYFI